MSHEIIIVAIGCLALFVLMPGIIAYASYQEKKLKLQRDLAKSGGEDLRSELAKTLAEMERLNQRMAVIEKLVTDEDRRLSSEIERLRRDPVNPSP